MQNRLPGVYYFIKTSLSSVYIDFRFLSKSQILSATSSDEQHSSKSVLDVLKEMSRKRIRVQVTMHFL
jgi:hypothetical protein